MAANAWNLQRLSKFCNYGQSAVLLTAVHLDLFGCIGKRKIDASRAAARFGGNAASWEMFLDALTAMGLLLKSADRYRPTSFAAQHLCGDGRRLLLPVYDAWNSWGKLASVLTTGRRPREQKPFASEPLHAERLLQGLHLHAKQIAPHVIARINLKESRTLLDLGGGLGTFAQAFCHRYPRLRATLIEHPNILPLARRAVNDAGMARRVRMIGLDFLHRSLPRGFDVVFISNILHAHGTRENLSLLRRVWRSLNAGGLLIVRDVFVHSNRTAPRWAALFSLSLLLHTPRGRCYEFREVHDWLKQAGFLAIRGPLRSSPLPFDPDSIVIARKSDV